MLAYIGIGSNLGDRQNQIVEAVRKLGEQKSIQILRVSPLYETQPMEMDPEAPLFINCVIEIQTFSAPETLLQTLLLMESEMGRIRNSNVRFSSRTIDMDILLCDDQVINSPTLSVPHPRMLHRCFVLKPLNDLCPNRVIAGTGMTVQTALRRLHCNTGLVPVSL